MCTCTTQPRFHKAAAVKLSLDFSHVSTACKSRANVLAGVGKELSKEAWKNTGRGLRSSGLSPNTKNSLPDLALGSFFQNLRDMSALCQKGTFRL